MPARLVVRSTIKIAGEERRDGERVSTSAAALS